jgi:hypothetical protein
MTDIFVAMPVYDGASFLAESIRSVLAQTYSGYRLVVSVDPSRDASAAIARSFENDGRVTVIEQPKRLGWPGNFNWLARQCDLPFFCYWQQDDMASTGYLEALRAELLTNPAAALAFTDVQWFGAAFHRSSTETISSGSSLGRVLQAVEAIRYEPLRGLIRIEALPSRDDMIRDHGPGPSQSEFPFIAEIAAKGDLLRSDRAMYFKRAHSTSVHRAWNEDSKERKHRAWIRMGAEMLEVARRYADPSQAGQVLAMVLDRLSIRRHGRGFYTDVAAPSVVARQLIAEGDLDLSGGEWEIKNETGLERPVHPSVVRAINELSLVHRRWSDLGLDTIEDDFTDTGQGQHLLGDGWSTPEKWGVWSNGEVAVLRVPCGERGLQLTLHGRAFPPDRPARVGVVTDRNAVNWMTLHGNAWTLPIAIQPQAGRRAACITLLLPEAAKASDHGFPGDDRILCIGLVQIIARPNDKAPFSEESGPP